MLVELDEQGNKLNRISRMTDEINGNMTVAKAHMTNLKRGFFTSLFLPSAKPKSQNKSESLTVQPSSKRSIGSTASSSTPSLNGDLNHDLVSSSSSSPSSLSSLADRIDVRTISDVDQALAPHLTQLQCSIRDIRTKALILGDTLDSHTALISDIHERVDLAHSRVKKTNKDIHSVLC